MRHIKTGFKFFLLIVYLLTSSPIHTAHAEKIERALIVDDTVDFQGNIHNISDRARRLFLSISQSHDKTFLEQVRLLKKIFARKGIKASYKETINILNELNSSPSFDKFQLKRKGVTHEIEVREIEYLSDISPSKRQVAILREFLKEFNIKISDKGSLERILINMNRDELARKGRFYDRSVQLLDAHESLKEKTRYRGTVELDTHIIEVIKDVERNFNTHLKRGERQALAYFHEILASDKLTHREIVLLRKSLEAVGTPTAKYSDDMLRMNLMGLEVFQEEARHKKVNEKKAIEALRALRNQFDLTHYEQLKESTKFKNSLKNFTPQFIMFQAALGFTIYRQYVTDPFVYGASKTPEPLSTFAEGLTGLGVVSFFIFITVMQSTQKQLYRLGMKWNSKTLKSMSPFVGLGTGFFVSHVFDELTQDVNLHQCVKSLVADESEDHLLVTPCESSYMKWIKNSKWKEYGLDILAMMSSSWISHKIIASVVSLMRASAKGSAILSQIIAKVGPRVTGFFGFFVSLVSFMEVHKVLDAYVVQPLKVDVVVSKMRSTIEDFTEDNKEKYFANRDDFIEDIQYIGHQFSHWPEIRGMNYQPVFYSWKNKTDKTTVTYEAIEKVLSYLFSKSQTLDEIKKAHKREIQEENKKRDELLSKSPEAKHPAIDEEYDINQELIEEEHKFFLKSSIDFIGINQNIYNKREQTYLDIICPYLEDKNIKNEFEFYASKDDDDGWLFLCANRDQEREEVTAYGAEGSYRLEGLVHNLTPLLLAALEKEFPLIGKNQYLSTEEVRAYLSEEPNQLFSPKMSIDNLDQGQKILLAKTLLAAYNRDIDSPYSSQAEIKMKQWVCASEGLSDMECLQESVSKESLALVLVIDLRLRTKALAAGLYVFKDFASKAFPGLYAYKANTAKHTYSSTVSNHDYKLSEQEFYRLSFVLEFMDTYRQGEKFFSQEERKIYQLNDSQGQNIYYGIFYNLICGDSEGDISSDGNFSAPQMFPELASVCRAMDSSFSYMNPSLWRVSEQRKTLFHRPVLVNGEKYSSIFAALGASIGKRFSSEKELLKAFHSQSEPTIQEGTQGIVDSLYNITENYMKPQLLNSSPEVLNKTQCEEIKSYYSLQNTDEFKGLEIFIFQVNFWLDQIYKMKKHENEINFDEIAFHKNNCRILKLMKSYHDLHAQGQKILPLSPKDLVDLNFTTNPLSEFEGQEFLSTFIPREFLVMSMLDTTYSHWDKYWGTDNRVFINGLSENYVVNLEDQDRAAYSLIVEFNRSLGNFYEHLKLLGMKKGFEEVISKKD